MASSLEEWEGHLASEEHIAALRARAKSSSAAPVAPGAGVVTGPPPGLSIVKVNKKNNETNKENLDRRVVVHFVSQKGGPVLPVGGNAANFAAPSQSRFLFAQQPDERFLCFGGLEFRLLFNFSCLFKCLVRLAGSEQARDGRGCRSRLDASSQQQVGASCAGESDEKVWRVFFFFLLCFVVKQPEVKPEQPKHSNVVPGNGGPGQQQAVVDAPPPSSGAATTAAAAPAASAPGNNNNAAPPKPNVGVTAQTLVLPRHSPDEPARITVAYRNGFVMEYEFPDVSIPVAVLRKVSDVASFFFFFFSNKTRFFLKAPAVDVIRRQWLVQRLEVVMGEMDEQLPRAAFQNRFALFFCFCSLCLTFEQCVGLARLLSYSFGNAHGRALDLEEDRRRALSG